MQISKLRLENYGVFTDADITLATKDGNENGSNITVFIGNNGSGKTSILDAIATGLSWFVAKLEDKNAQGKSIDKSKINISALECTISFEKKELGKNSGERYPLNEISLKLSKVRKHAESNLMSSYITDNIKSFTSSYREILTKNTEQEINLPITAYYGATRHTYTSKT
ncbi:AAA family ATPase [Proteus columbae]|uniref:AAA family ATPase n=1 Tax=Proteus columbae TaxID=1987580 RepID=UPI0034D6481E